MICVIALVLIKTFLIIPRIKHEWIILQSTSLFPECVLQQDALGKSLTYPYYLMAISFACWKSQMMLNVFFDSLSGSNQNSTICIFCLHSQTVATGLISSLRVLVSSSFHSPPNGCKPRKK